MILALLIVSSSVIDFPSISAQTFPKVNGTTDGKLTNPGKYNENENYHGVKINPNTFNATAYAHILTKNPKIQSASIHTQGNTGPVITSVSVITATQTQTIIISGSGFGTGYAYNNEDCTCIQLTDVSNDKWNAGYWNPQQGNYGDWVTLNIASWTDSQIVITGFSGSYGLFGWTINPGDTEEISIWNWQTENGPTTYYTTVLSSTSPSTTSTIVSLNSPMINAGEQITVTATVTDTSSNTNPTGAVTFNDGSPSAGGVFSSTACNTLSNNQLVCTATYTAPNTAESVTITGNYVPDNSNFVATLGMAMLTVLTPSGSSTSVSGSSIEIESSLIKNTDGTFNFTMQLSPPATPPTNGALNFITFDEDSNDENQVQTIVNNAEEQLHKAGFTIPSNPKISFFFASRDIIDGTAIELADLITSLPSDAYDFVDLVTDFGIVSAAEITTYEMAYGLVPDGIPTDPVALVGDIANYIYSEVDYTTENILLSAQNQNYDTFWDGNNFHYLRDGYIVGNAQEFEIVISGLIPPPTNFQTVTLNIDGDYDSFDREIDEPVDQSCPDSTTQYCRPIA